MPRLTHPRAVATYAIGYLVDLYFQDQDFVEELGELRRKHAGVIHQIAVATDQGLEEIMRSPLPLHQLLFDCAAKPTSEIDTSAYQDFTGRDELAGYLRDLAALCHRWKLRTSLALAVLIPRDMADALEKSNSAPTADPRLGFYDRWQPWPPPLPPLVIRVSAWDVAYIGRGEVQSRIAERLRQYEGQIKQTGFKEYPTALHQHARWWFDHHVQGKKYGALAEEYPSATEESIRRAVWRFSKIVGIRMR